MRGLAGDATEHLVQPASIRKPALARDGLQPERRRLPQEFLSPADALLKEIFMRGMP